MSFDQHMGPINYVVAGFETATVPTEGLAALAALAEAGRICVLDVEFVAKAADGTVTTVPGSSVGAPDFEGAASDLIDADDVALVGESLVPGGTGVVVVYEDLALIPVLQAWAAEGATVVTEGPIILDDLVATLDATEKN